MLRFSSRQKKLSLDGSIAQTTAISSAWRSCLRVYSPGATRPMPALDHDRHRQVVHQLTGIAGVSLQQYRLLMAATANPGTVVELALGAIL